MIVALSDSVLLEKLEKEKRAAESAEKQLNNLTNEHKRVILFCLSDEKNAKLLKEIEDLSASIQSYTVGAPEPIITEVGDAYNPIHDVGVKDFSQQKNFKFLLKSALRKARMLTHPDRVGGNTEKFQLCKLYYEAGDLHSLSNLANEDFLKDTTTVNDQLIIYERRKKFAEKAISEMRGAATFIAIKLFVSGDTDAAILIINKMLIARVALLRNEEQKMKFIQKIS